MRYLNFATSQLTAIANNTAAHTPNPSSVQSAIDINLLEGIKNHPSA